MLLLLLLLLAVVSLLLLLLLLLAVAVRSGDGSPASMSRAGRWSEGGVGGGDMAMALGMLVLVVDDIVCTKKNVFVMAGHCFLELMVGLVLVFVWWIVVCRGGA
jgi:hypothetical protein